MLNLGIKRQIGRVTFSVIGDSTSAKTVLFSWPYQLIPIYNGGLCNQLNNALGGHTVVSNMDAQIDQCEINCADFTLILLGYNDALPAPTFQSVYRDNLIELYGTLGKPIYCMGLINYTGEGAERTTKNGYISAAVTEAIAAGVNTIYWNTDDWINPVTDLTDGVHPNATGAAKIAAEILIRLPAWVTPTTKYMRLETTGKILYG